MIESQHAVLGAEPIFNGKVRVDAEWVLVELHVAKPQAHSYLVEPVKEQDVFARSHRVPLLECEGSTARDS